MIAPAHPKSSGGRAALAWVLAVAAAGLALASGFLVTEVARLRTENAALKTQRDLAAVGFDAAETRLKLRSLVAEGMINDLGRQLRAQDPFRQLKITTLLPPSGEPAVLRAVVVWDPTRQTGLLAVENLPASDAGHDYQLWLAQQDRPEPIRGCVFHVGPGARVVVPFTSSPPFAAVTGFTVTLEKKGGSATLEGPTVLQGTN